MLTRIQIYELDELIEALNKAQTPEDKRSCLENRVEDIPQFLTALRKVRKDTGKVTPKRKAVASTPQVQVYQKEAVLEYFQKVKIESILAEHTKAELEAMYYAVYQTKPLSAARKERIAENLKQLADMHIRTKALLG